MNWLAPYTPWILGVTLMLAIGVGLYIAYMVLMKADPEAIDPAAETQPAEPVVQTNQVERLKELLRASHEILRDARLQDQQLAAQLEQELDEEEFRVLLNRLEQEPETFSEEDLTLYTRHTVDVGLRISEIVHQAEPLPRPAVTEPLVQANQGPTPQVEEDEVSERERELRGGRSNPKVVAGFALALLVVVAAGMYFFFTTSDIPDIWKAVMVVGTVALMVLTLTPKSFSPSKMWRRRREREVEVTTTAATAATRTAETTDWGKWVKNGLKLAAVVLVGYLIFDQYGKYQERERLRLAALSAANISSTGHKCPSDFVYVARREWGEPVEKPAGCHITFERRQPIAYQAAMTRASGPDTIKTYEVGQKKRSYTPDLLGIRLRVKPEETVDSVVVMVSIWRP